MEFVTETLICYTWHSNRVQQLTSDRSLVIVILYANDNYFKRLDLIFLLQITTFHQMWWQESSQPRFCGVLDNNSLHDSIFHWKVTAITHINRLKQKITKHILIDCELHFWVWLYASKCVISPTMLSKNSYPTLWTHGAITLRAIRY